MVWGASGVVQRLVFSDSIGICRPPEQGIVVYIDAKTSILSSNPAIWQFTVSISCVRMWEFIHGGCLVSFCYQTFGQVLVIPSAFNTRLTVIVSCERVMLFRKTRYIERLPNNVMTLNVARFLQFIGATPIFIRQPAIPPPALSALSWAVFSL